MNGLKIRWKLTLWYGCVLSVVLLVFGTVVFLVTRHHLMRRIDQGLREELADVLSEVNRAKTADELKDWLERRFAGHAGFDFQITTRDGERFFYNPRLAEKEWPLPTRDMDSSVAIYQTLPVETTGNWRIVHLTVDGPDGPFTVQVGRPLEAFEHELNELLFTFFLTGPLTILVAISGGYFLASRVLRPVQEMTQAAKAISADSLHERIAIINPHDELGVLGETLNQMIERLEQSFIEIRRFTADAAHELRTPLAIIRNEAEVTLRSPRSEGEYCHVLENVLDETNQLSLVADQLLFLCRQDAGLSPPVRETVTVDKLLIEVVSNMQAVAHEKHVSIVLGDNPACQMLGDRQQLNRVFYNLIDNAIKYTNSHGRISVSSCVQANEVTIRVSDNGCGIPPEHLPKIFDRFYRVDASRTANGTGLGLAICQSIVRGCGGVIVAQSTVGEGTTFTVRLPKANDGTR